MTERTVYESIQEPLDEEERILMDPETWDWENSIEGVPNPNAGAILSIHPTRDEVIRLESVARAEGMTMHAFIKQAALARIPHETAR